MMSTFRLALAATILAAVFSPHASAATPPALRITVNTGQGAVIDAAGTVVFSGTCTPVTCTTAAGYPQITSGQTLWSGKLGTFTVRTAIGVTKPTAIPSPSEDLDLQQIATTADGIIKFEWTDVDFNYTDITGGQLQAGGSRKGTVSSTYSAYFDGSNTQFGTGTLAATVGPLTTSSFSGTTTGPGPTGAPFSMTIVATLTMAANSSLTVDTQFYALPTPLKLTCAANTGQVGVPYASALMAVGGITPYTFSIISGSLPSGLTLNPNTGAITGTPTQGGTATFTGQVVDSSISAADTVAQACTIVVTTPPPISLSCPYGTGQVGVPYISALVAAGGVPPYLYSISSGLLPNALSLNSSTGAITGTTPDNIGRRLALQP